MKNLFLIFSIMSVFSNGLAAKNIEGIDDNLSVIQKALSEGDANTLSNYFDATLEITLLEKYDVLDKPKATESLKNFFAKNKPRTYNTVHHGSSKGSASHYTIGDMQTASGNYRVSIYYKSSGNNVLIQEIRIEK
jgi:hypothetical protein